LTMPRVHDATTLQAFYYCYYLNLSPGITTLLF
jgi:hypothetical protein